MNCGNTSSRQTGSDTRCDDDDDDDDDDRDCTSPFQRQQQQHLRCSRPHRRGQKMVEAASILYRGNESKPLQTTVAASGETDQNFNPRWWIKFQQLQI
jgi:hypothetical protein